jgi:hypothetical protein
MFGNKRWPAAALAAGLLIGCGKEPSTASKSAEHEHGAQAEETEGHESHAGHEGHQMPKAAPGASTGHQHGTTHETHEAHEGHSAPAKGSAVDHSTMGHGAEKHAGHAPRPGAPAEAGHDHSGHSQPAPAPAAQPAAPAHDHSGHSQPAQPAAPAPEPEAPSPGQPAETLSPDALDSPATTSVQDAQRAQAMAQGGSHAGHAGTYTHVDVGRSGEQAPEKKTAAVYSCPMHPEVTSNGPGTCQKCGMALVERREE